jgi:hypothetical protein
MKGKYMSCYIAIVPTSEKNQDLDSQKVVLLGVHGERILALFSSRRLCEDAIEAHPLELDGVRAIPRVCNRAELTDLVELMEISGIGFVVFDPVLVLDKQAGRQWSTELAPIHLSTYVALLKGELPKPEENGSEDAVSIADHRSMYPEDLPIETMSSISRLKNVLDDVRAKIEEWEI